MKLSILFLTEHEWSTSFIKHMNERGKKLFNDDCFLTNIYLDPRFKLTIAETHLERVKIHLRSIYNTVISFKNKGKGK